MVLLSHFHSLSSFVFSCGLTQKLDGLSSPKLKTPPATLSSTQTPTGTTMHHYGAAENIAQLQQMQQQTINAAAPATQKTVLSEISLNNNNNSMDLHNHQMYCNNNAAAAAAASAVGVNGVNKLNGKLNNYH